MPTLVDLETENAKLIERNDALERELKILREELAILKKGLFGRRSERLDPGQPGLFGSEEAEERTQREEKPTKREKKKGHGREPFAANVPRQTHELDIPEDERTCSICGKALQPMGADVIERGHWVPGHFVVNRYVKHKHGCPDGHEVKTAEALSPVIDRGKFEASVYAHVAVSKYCDHTPLHRLAGIHKRHGVHLPKQTMWNMLVTLDELVAQPILNQMWKEVVTSAILHSDDTAVTYRIGTGKGSHNGHVWDFRAPGGDDPDRTLVHFSLSQAGSEPKRMLGDWRGTLVSDGHSCFNEVCRENGITRAGCWAHARRKVKEAFDLHIPGAEEVLAPIQRLFRLERAMKKRVKARGQGWNQLLALRRRVREERSRKVLERIHQVAAEVSGRRATMPKSKLGKALAYLDNQREPLAVFLDDPRVEIHNNDSERDLRHVVLGRKNYLVFGSIKGAEVASRIYSLILSCKHAGIDPEAYIEDVLVRVSTTPESQVASLTPWAWAEERRRAAQPTS